MQINLAFVDLPEPVEQLWDQLDEALRAVILDRLAQAIAKTAAAQLKRQKKEIGHD